MNVKLSDRNNEFEGTKGEWSSNGLEIRSKSGMILANAYKHLPANQSRQEGEANAKLIAAAPELLEAVKATEAFFDDMPKGQFGNLVCNVGLMNDMFLNISRAINKALK